MLIAWIVVALTPHIEGHLQRSALDWVNAVNVATDRAELDVLIPQVERWVARSTLHVRAYLRADEFLAGLEYAFDPRKHAPMTESAEREREPLPLDCTHNAEARARLRALCMAMLSRTVSAA